MGRGNPNNSAEIRKLHKLSTRRSGSDFLHWAHNPHQGQYAGSLTGSQTCNTQLLKSLFFLDPCIASAESSVQYMREGGEWGGGVYFRRTTSVFEPAHRTYNLMN